MCTADKKAQEKGSNELPRLSVPQKWDVLLNSKSVHCIYDISTLKCYLGIRNYEFHKVSETPKHRINLQTKLCPHHNAEGLENVSDKIGLHQL